LRREIVFRLQINNYIVLKTRALGLRALPSALVMSYSEERGQKRQRRSLDQQKRQNGNRDRETDRERERERERERGGGRSIPLKNSFNYLPR